VIFGCAKSEKRATDKFLIMIKSICIFLTIFMILAGAALARAERLSVNVDIANVRAGPSTDATVIWQVEKYHPVKVIKKQGDWDLFEDFEGDHGWIEKSLLADTKCVIAKKDNCNVRSGPGTNFDIRFTVDKGVPFKVLGKKGDWIHVVHADGDQGWIYRSLVW
jgi:SH3-like domain-containing protein